MQFFPFFGDFAANFKAMTPDSGAKGLSLKAGGAKAEAEAEIPENFGELLKRLEKSGDKAASEAGERGYRLVLDERTGRIRLVESSDKDGAGRQGGDLRDLLAREQRDGSAVAGELIRARIDAEAGKKAEDTDGSEPSSRFRAALASLLGGGKAEVGLGELKVSKEDFAALKEVLAEAGMSKSDLAELKERIAGEKGISFLALADFIGKSLEGLDLGKKAGLIEGRSLQNFFQKLGFTPQQGRTLLDRLESGEQAGVWREVVSRVANLPQGSSVELKSSEIEALARVMDLPPKSEARILGLMSGGESVRAGKEKLLMAVRVLAQESARQEAGELDKASALREAVARVFLMAREREASRSRADHGPDDTARKYRLLAEDNARNDSAESGEKTARDGSRAERVAERWLSDGKPSGAEDAAARAAHKQESREAGALGERARLRAEVKEDGAAARDGKDSGSEKFGGDRESKASADERRAVREFTAKIRSDAAVNLRAEAGAERADAAAAQRAAEIFKDGPGNFEQILRQEGSSARQVLSQVRAGMLKNIAPGRQQLTLQLDPPDLGKLHLMLQVSNNEVRAVIRADNHEAGRLLAEHMAQLKAGLEAQGLRVNKLEVQTNAQNNDGPQQQGQQQQAGGQEGGPGQGGKEKAGRAGLLGRWLRGDVDEEALAQEMQNAEEKARTSPRGLDLFA